MASGGSRRAPYGSWSSPIGIDDVVGRAISLADVLLDGEDVLWTEGRPWEAGRRTIVRRAADGTIADVTAPEFNIRTRVQEYGGGAYAVHDGLLVFSSFADGRVHAQSTRDGGEARPLTPDPASGSGDRRYADFAFDPSRDRILAVSEDHSGPGEAVNSIVGIPLGGGTPRVLVSGHDFFAAPRPSPDGRRLAWLSWDHPNMPWDGTSLWVAGIAADGSIGRPDLVAGGPAEWITQPGWSPDGRLWFVAERDEWATLMSADQYAAGADSTRSPVANAEFAPPDWVFARPTWTFLPDGRIVAVARSGGRDRIWLIEPEGSDGATPEATELAVPHTEMSYVVGGGTSVAFLGGQPEAPTELVILDVDRGDGKVVRRASDASTDPAYVSPPEPISFPTAGGETSHALYYQPRNPDWTGLDGELPPLVVRSHGGPTSAAGTNLNLAIQLLTSRGIAVVDVDYRGSTGYGRAYRRRLEAEWGVVDVEDCVAAAQALIERGAADPARVCITGGSAGGYTTLAALTFTRAFAAGMSYFGIGDLEAFVRDTHKFESRYMDRLVGPYPAEKQTYRERSPIHFVDRLACPILLLQGLDDRVVPPNQAKDMADALRAKGIPYAYLAFEGEGHGFRGQLAQRRSLEAELSFLGQVFGFTPADRIEPIELVRPATSSARVS